MKKFTLLLLLFILLLPLMAQETVPSGEFRVRWRFSTSGPVRSTPLLTEGMLLVGSDDGVVYALDSEKGSLLWKRDLQGALPCRPAAMDKQAFFLTRSGNLYALDTSDGKILWTHEVGPFPIYENGWDYFLPSPVLAGGRLLLLTPAGEVTALDPQSGKLLWKSATGAPVRSAPAFDSKTLYVGNLEGRLTAMSLDNGKVLWTFKTKGETYFPKGEIFFSPSLQDGRLFVSSRDFHVYALDANTGRLLWKSLHKGSWATALSTVPGELYSCSSDGRFVERLDPATGKELWKLSTKDLVFTTPEITAQEILFGSHDGRFYAVERSSGKLKALFDTRSPVLSSPVSDSLGRVFFGTDDGSIYSLESVKRTLYRVVYWDAAQKPLWFSGDTAAREAYRDAGYTVLDTPGLEKFIHERILDGVPSVVVFTQSTAPRTLLFPEGGGEAPLISFFRRGGRGVWLGLYPLVYLSERAPDGTIKQGKPEEKVPALLQIPYSGYYDAYRAEVTEEGTRWGLPAWTLGSWGVDPSKVTVVLAKDGKGKATAWFKNYGGSPFGGLLFLWGQRHNPTSWEPFIKASEAGL